MARSTPAADRAIAKVAEAFGKETAVRLNAELEARNLIANKIADAKRATDSAIEEALRTGAVLRHIHNLGLGTKNSKRVYEVKNAMDWTETVSKVTDIVMTDYVVAPRYGDHREWQLQFTTSVGPVAFWRPENPVDDLEAVDAEQQEMLDSQKDKFVEAAKKYFDEQED